MKLIKPSFEILEQGVGIDGMFEHMEACGRTCYKSEDKITEESAPKFVDMLINRGHTAALEHGTVYLKIANTEGSKAWQLADKYRRNKYSSVTEWENPNDQSNRGISYTLYCITTNYRVLLQNGWLDDLKYQCEPTEYHEKRVTVKFICDRGVTAEYNRHRINSIAEMSTRYVAFDKDKFGGELSIIHPCWIPDSQLEMNRRNSPTLTDLKGYCDAISNHTDIDTFSVIDYWLFANFACEYAYLNLRRLGWQAQQARIVLPLGLQTELVHTATVSQWEGFFKLRCAKDAHPQARELAEPLHAMFRKKGLVNVLI